MFILFLGSEDRYALIGLKNLEKIQSITKKEITLAGNVNNFNYELSVNS